MDTLLGWLPFLKSPRFWGIVVTATFQLALTKGWLDQATTEWLRNIAAAATAVGVIGWATPKINATSTKKST